MSELKAHKAYNRWIDEEMPTPNDDLICNEVYLKSEADKYINLLKDKANYNEFAYKLKSEELADTCRFYEDELRHQKHRRCLAMAKMCDEVMMSCELRGYTVLRIWANKHEWAMRWKYRWLELSEKFKEVK